MSKYTRCSHCKQLLPEDEFASNAHEASGRQHECRACRKRYYQEGFEPRDKLDPATVEAIRCPRCGRTLPTSEFHLAAGRPNGRQVMCKECRHEYDREYYANNPDYRERMRETVGRRRENIMDYINAYLATHPCVDCGETDPVVLQFHHQNGDEKDFAVAQAAQKSLSLAKIDAEIAKCIVLCANCHIRRTEKARNRNHRKQAHDLDVT